MNSKADDKGDRIWIPMLFLSLFYLSVMLPLGDDATSQDWWEAFRLLLTVFSGAVVAEYFAKRRS